VPAILQRRSETVNSQVPSSNSQIAGRIGRKELIPTRLTENSGAIE
jgi:hypothetical protein